MIKLIIGIILLFVILISAHYVFVEGEESLTLENVMVQENFQDGIGSGIYGETYENQFNMDCYDSLTWGGDMDYPDKCCKSFLENDSQFLQNYSNYLQNNEWNKDCVTSPEKLQELHKKIVLKCVKDTNFNSNVLLEDKDKCGNYFQNNNYSYSGIDNQLNEPGFYGCMVDDQCELSSKQVNWCSPKCKNDVKINKIDERCDIHGDCYEERYISNIENMCNSIHNQQNCDNTEGCQYDYENYYCKSSYPPCEELYYDYDCSNNNECSWNSDGGYCSYKNENENCYNIYDKNKCENNDKCIYIKYDTSIDTSNGGTNYGMCDDKKNQCSFNPMLLSQIDRDTYCKRVCESIQNDDCSNIINSESCEQINNCEYSNKVFTCVSKSVS